ncbi:MAG TPA: diacylglycerol kinase family protein [Pyrinomonadaceae bacterium]|nr:diacylglycerol kinase family protein [Pyrinomonadaceae bacterium]
MRTSTLVIINPASARARRAWPGIKEALVEAGVQFDAHETTHAGDATLRTRAALREGYRTIAVVGGDGTLSEAASGFFDFAEEGSQDSARLPAPVNPEAALAILPAGTGDDFARGLSGGREPLDKWLAHFIAHCRGEGASAFAHAVDAIYGRVEQGERAFICVNVATIGLGAEVAARVASQRGLVRRLPGEARFVSAACGALAAWRERRVRVRVDESEVIESRTNLIAVVNGRYAGGGMMFAPDASNDDGLIDLVLTRDLNRASILRELPRIRRGAHLANPRVRIIKARSVRVETDEEDDALLVEADGNVRGHTPAEFRIMPGALRIIQKK